jgi:hypothetical protein
MNFLLTHISRKVGSRITAAMASVSAVIMMILILSVIELGTIANPVPVQAQKLSSPLPPTMKDIFKVIVTLIGVNKTSGDIVSFVNVDGMTQVKTFNAAKIMPVRGSDDGTLELFFSFPNAIIKTGAEFRACTIILKDLRMSCEKGQNSLALRPEFVDMYLNSAKRIKVPSLSSPTEKVAAGKIKST